MQPTLHHLQLLLEGEEVIRPATRRRLYQLQPSAAARPHPINVWICPLRAVWGTLAGDWADVGLRPLAGRTFVALCTSGETLQVMHDPATDLWWILLNGSVFRAIRATPLPETVWPWRTLLWSDKAAVQALLGATVTLWPILPDGRGPLTEPLRVCAAYASDSLDQYGIGLLPVLPVATEVASSLDPLWPIRRLADCDAAHQHGQRVDGAKLSLAVSVRPLVVVWAETFTGVARSRVLVEGPAPRWRGTTAAHELLVHDALGADPGLWDVAESVRDEPASKKAVKKAVAVFCILCLKAGNPRVEAVENALCAQHLALVARDKRHGLGKKKNKQADALALMTRPAASMQFRPSNQEDLYAPDSEED